MSTLSEFEKKQVERLLAAYVHKRIGTSTTNSALRIHSFLFADGEPKPTLLILEKRSAPTLMENRKSTEIKK